jgi:hypothetical protein
MSENDPFAEFEANRQDWANGGIERLLAHNNLTMTHNQLEAVLGPETVKVITDAGFVLVPLIWRTRIFKSLSTSK